ncbi:uncharacterized protein LOC107767836 [Nicotiana tabacum]|uniref:Uncharacterized protein LOC107767836 n=1 Tax=Nicotiana tabacum TaxID=4097 RepID=A0A1S3XR35_TOBAC|nr:PREDICTED: uncharacterized protein LOC107767836 [Nicotiana tabacum]
MADFEPPSFSLGLDFDIDSEPQSTVLPTIQEADDIETPTIAADTEDSDPPRSLKRLRRGLISKSEPAAQKIKLGDAWCSVDEDIEEFSSQDDEPKDHPKQYSSVCSSSKISLQGRRVLSSQSASRCTGRKNDVSNVSSISRSMETSTSNFVFPELTVSPLRRFQLIDSDSDEPSKSEVMEKESEHVNSPLSGNPHNTGADSSCQRNSGFSVGKLKTRDLWEDFCSDKTFNISTPALDEVCEEYFKSVKHGKNKQTINSGLTESSVRPQGPLLPAHCYFFHKDPRIQELVRDRLPNFFPLGAENIPGQKQDDASVIDYMGQFCHEGSKKTSKNGAVATNSRKSRKNVKQPNSVEESQGSERWVNPKRSAVIPKDAGRRRVQAVGKSAGHWYTTGDGKKVYVAKNGQEFSGQSAYRCYRKETGAGFKKSTKKTTGKRKAASKKK